MPDFLYPFARLALNHPPVVIAAVLFGAWLFGSGLAEIAVSLRQAQKDETP